MMRAAGLFVLILLHVVASNMVAGDPLLKMKIPEIHVSNEGRPLNEALGQIEQKFGIPIYFEEAQPAAEDLVDGSQLGFQKGISLLKIRELAVRFPDEELTAVKAIRVVLDEYARAGFSRPYEIRTVPSRGVAVVPVQSVVAEQKISLESKKRSFLETIEAVAEAIGQRCRCRVISLASASLDESLGDITAVEEPALTFLTGLGGSAGPRSTYKFLYDCTDHSYYLNWGVISTAASAKTPSLQLFQFNAPDLVFFQTR